MSHIQPYSNLEPTCFHNDKIHKHDLRYPSPTSMSVLISAISPIYELVDASNGLYDGHQVKMAQISSGDTRTRYYIEITLCIVLKLPTPCSDTATPCRFINRILKKFQFLQLLALPKAFDKVHQVTLNSYCCIKLTFTFGSLCSLEYTGEL